MIVSKAFPTKFYNPVVVLSLQRTEEESPTNKTLSVTVKAILWGSFLFFRHNILPLSETKKS